jgi:hypothetical protein
MQSYLGVGRTTLLPKPQHLDTKCMITMQFCHRWHNSNPSLPPWSHRRHGSQQLRRALILVLSKSPLQVKFDCRNSSSFILLLFYTPLRGQGLIVGIAASSSCGSCFIQASMAGKSVNSCNSLSLLVQTSLHGSRDLIAGVAVISFSFLWLSCNASMLGRHRLIAGIAVVSFISLWLLFYTASLCDAGQLSEGQPSACQQPGGTRPRQKDPNKCQPGQTRNTHFVPRTNPAISSPMTDSLP